MCMCACACVEGRGGCVGVYMCVCVFVCVRALTRGKVAKQKKLSSGFQLANIQIFCTGEGTSISIVHIWIRTMESRFLRGKYLKRLETRNSR